ncbi:hypothetical protein TNCV_1579911 [Trichonephila clavipes]|nr:hypothetical protein TNCV_1579911 [Trichonephila clavipes]
MWTNGGMTKKIELDILKRFRASPPSQLWQFQHDLWYCRLTQPSFQAIHGEGNTYSSPNVMILSLMPLKRHIMQSRLTQVKYVEAQPSSVGVVRQLGEGSISSVGLVNLPWFRRGSAEGDDVR